jgi:acetoin utilization deacetylase AcuC-like enzyme
MELTNFHSEDYINFLARVTPDNQDEMHQQLIQASASFSVHRRAWKRRTPFLALAWPRIG